MRDRIDRTSRVPLYVQLSEALRYRIATGEISPGARLPSLRSAARLWGVNLHTVRKTYALLVEQGLVRTTPHSGTVILDAAPSLLRRDRTAHGLEGFIADVLIEARREWGLSPVEVVQKLRGRIAAGTTTPTVYVVECSHPQAEDLAGQLERVYAVRAMPWSLERSEMPPEGATVLATYFHFNDLRTKWPERFADVHFAATHPDPMLRARVAEVDGSLGGVPLDVPLCENDLIMARNICADLHHLLPPPEYALHPTVESPVALLDSGRPVLFSPRVWGNMGLALRARSNALQVRYLFKRPDLESIGRDLGWGLVGEPT
ncbi:MAG: GntR family transcriptional regulator [Gemmatimonadota bacterium]